MRAHALLDAADRLPLVGLEALLGDGGAVIVAPHPDDESLGCGALIAEAAAKMRQVRVAILSDGVGSHPCSKAYPAERLRDVREDEARAAGVALGLAEAHMTFLRLPDRKVPDQGAQAAWAVAALVSLCEEARASALFVTWRHDPHCDHQAAYALARAAQQRCSRVRLFEYSVWGRSLPDEAVVSHALGGCRFDGAAWRDHKQAAIACHRSQLGELIDDDPAGFRLSAADLARFDRLDEVFLEAHA